MRLSNVLLALFRFLIPPALILTLLLYFYAPLIECNFQPARRAEAGCSIPGQQKAAIPQERAPFRLLAFGDPQLEGDTSVPRVQWPDLEDLKAAGVGPVVGLFKGVLKGWRKRIDLWGNDLYLAHIYRSVSWWSQPTHTVVLGDLLGSQWIGDAEFQRRSERFWKKVFKGMEKVSRSITESSGRVEALGQDESWRRRVIAVAGNHDIGYAGDIDERVVVGCSFTSRTDESGTDPECAMVKRSISGMIKDWAGVSVRKDFWTMAENAIEERRKRKASSELGMNHSSISLVSV